jgi:hypothetical protein
VRREPGVRQQVAAVGLRGACRGGQQVFDVSPGVEAVTLGCRGQAQEHGRDGLSRRRGRANRRLAGSMSREELAFKRNRAVVGSYPVYGPK